MSDGHDWSRIASDGSRAVPWKAADAASATAVVIAGFLAVLLLAWLVAGVFDAADRAILTPWVVLAIEGTMLLAVWAFGIRRYRIPWADMGLRRPNPRISLWLPWVALFGSLGFTGVYAAVVSALGFDALLPPPLPDDLLGSGLSRLSSTLIIVLWGPFAEEVFFRGFLLAALIVPLGAVRAAVVTSALFAAAHLMFAVMVPIFVTGLLLSWLYLRSRSIWPSLVAHASQNLIALSVAM